MAKQSYYPSVFCVIIFICVFIQILSGSLIIVFFPQFLSLNVFFVLTPSYSIQYFS